jgi:hypothetical protein
MKTVLAATMVVALGLLLGTAVYAGPGGCPGPWAGGGQVDVNKFKAFQKETLPLRDEMAVKRLELRNEYAKDAPDQARVTALQHDMVDLRAKIRSAAQKQGLPAWGPGAGMGGGRGRGPGMMGRGCCGGPGQGPGSAGGSCPGWQ